jgi:hypothetical protein
MRTYAGEAHQSSNYARWNAVLKEIHIGQIKLSEFILLCGAINAASKFIGFQRMNELTCGKTYPYAV